MKIYLVRHGETLFNLKHRIQGWCDSPLTEEGKQQARCVAYGLRTVPFTHAYCSISERAQDTACCIVKDRKIPLTVTKDFKEIHFGDLEGEQVPPEVFLPLLEKGGFQAFHGESLAEAGERFLCALKSICEKEEGPLLVVSHGGIIMNLLHTLFPEESQVFMENCAVAILEYADGKFSLIQAPTTEYRKEGEKNYGIS